jgi:hypothetical protein
MPFQGVYGFSTFGQIALLAGIAVFSLAGLMLLPVGVGHWHARRVRADLELLPSSNEQELAA